MNVKKALLTLVLSSVVATAQQKVATVDVAKLFDGYYKTAETQKVVNVEKAKIQKENDVALKEVQALMSRHEDVRKKLEDPSLGEKKKVELLKEFEEIRQEGTQKEKSRVEYLQRKSAALNEKAAEDARGIFAEITEEINVIAEADGYDLVLNKASLGQKGVPVFIYTKEALDITEKIKAKLSEKAPKGE